MFGSRLLDTSPGRRSALSDLLGVSGRYAARPAHLRYMDGVGTSESGHGNYVSLAELAAQLKVSVQTIYDLRSKGRGPRGFRVGTQLRFRESEIDAWVQRMELADEQRHAGGAS
jgi:excisionase family DNA binding protein